MRRSIGVALGAAVLAVLLALGIAALRIHQVRLAYQLEALRAERVRAEQLLAQLRVEAATLRAPARLEARARALGLGVPEDGQVRLAREYVPVASTAAAARLSGARHAGTARPEALVR